MTCASVPQEVPHKEPQRIEEGCPKEADETSDESASIIGAGYGLRFAVMRGRRLLSFGLVKE